MKQGIKISRTNLIAKCDQYLNNEIQKLDLMNYALNLILGECGIYEWDDNLISDIVLHYDNQTINYPIHGLRHQKEKELLGGMAGQGNIRNPKIFLNQFVLNIYFKSDHN